MQIPTNKTFWFVKNPTNLSEIQDLVMCTTIPGLANYIRGGFDEKDIVGIYDNPYDAQRHAERIFWEKDRKKH